MKDSDSPRLKLTALGMDQRALDTLEMILKGPGGNWCELSSEETADIAILDGDVKDALTLFDQHRRRYPRRPIILLSVREMQLRRSVPLKKPAKVSTLMEALRQAQARLYDEPLTQKPVAVNKLHEASAEPTTSAKLAAFATPAPPADPDPKTASPVTQTAQLAEPVTRTPGSTRPARHSQQDEPDIDLTNPARYRQAFYQPDEHLQGLLQRALADARSQRRPVQVHNTQGLLLLQPTTQQAFTNLQERQLRSLCLIPGSDKSGWSRLSNAELKDLLVQIGTEQPPYSLDALLWQITLWTSRGRLPQGTDPDTLVSLRHWPNLTRLSLPPNALRIAALWSRSPETLAKTVRLLKLPRRHVFAFYSACHALDLVEIGSVMTTPAIVPDNAPENTTKRGFFQRIIHNLRGSN